MVKKKPIKKIVTSRRKIKLKHKKKIVSIKRKKSRGSVPQKTKPSKRKVKKKGSWVMGFNVSGYDF